MPPADTGPKAGRISLPDFVGKWHLSRDIKEHTGGTIRFTGEAILSGSHAQVAYRESGVVTLANNKTIPAERTYFWRAGLNGQIDVFFADERFFHSFSTDKPYAEHLCGDDRYKVTYDFTRWPVWTSVWQVKGPRKDYTMVSRYAACNET